MCNDYGNHNPYARYVEAFSQLKLPVLVEGNGPDLTPRDDIRIREHRAGDPAHRRWRRSSPR